jgi:fission process protein 1
VEEAVEWTFHKAFETIGGPNAVGHRPVTGREHALQVEARKGAVKEKEL